MNLNAFYRVLLVIGLWDFGGDGQAWAAGFSQRSDEELVVMLRSESPENQVLILEQLALRYRSPDALIIHSHAAFIPDAYALTKSVNTGLVSTVSAIILTNESVRVRAEAIEFYKEILNRTNISTVVEGLLDDPSPFVSVRASDLLLSFDLKSKLPLSPSLMECLRKNLNPTNAAYVLSNTLTQLDKVGGDPSLFAGPAKQLTRHPDSGVRKAARTLLGKLQLSD